MKKWIYLAAVMCFVAIIAACGTSGGSSEAGGVIDTDASAAEVVIKAKSWEFEQAEYKIKQGEAVNLKLESTDGVHGLQVTKTDITIPNNKSKTISLKAGEYTIVCNVPCGTGHTKMQAKLIVE
ncbi:cupredoxin domain-containing protein [Paenibacillus algorifonticola]|uniref:cupredoxin domain-containing protein n=1 Tax=Paenibacillus algorifonticola TaxID=684063 RepID=UPI003D26C14E